jgi:hypothetical protein
LALSPAIPDDDGCGVDNCDSNVDRGAVNANRVGLCAGTMPSSIRAR